MMPYMGHEGYIFISYAPEDTPRVFPVIKRLMLGGLRVCYAAEQEPNAEHTKDQNAEGAEHSTMQFAERLGNCALFIPMLSEAFCRTELCREALVFAQSRELNTLSVALEPDIYPLPEETGLPTPDGHVLFHTNPSDTVFFEQLMTADFPDSCRESKGSAGLSAEEIAAALPSEPPRHDFLQNLLWFLLMTAALALWVLSANDSFREQSVIAWAQILFAIAGFFGILTAEPHVDETAGPDNVKIPSPTRFTTWAKWLTAIVAAIPLVLRLPAGGTVRQVVGGLLTAAALLIGCHLCFPAGLDEAFARPPLAARAFGFVWFICALLYAGWYGMDYRFAFLTQSAGICFMVIYQYVTERTSGGTEERTANYLNVLLFFVSAVGIVYAVFFYNPLMELFGLLQNLQP